MTVLKYFTRLHIELYTSYVADVQGTILSLCQTKLISVELHESTMYYLETICFTRSYIHLCNRSNNNLFESETSELSLFLFWHLSHVMETCIVSIIIIIIDDYVARMEPTLCCTSSRLFHKCR